MPPASPQITEFFGVFLAYTEIVEKSRLFGKCPLHWNYERNRLTVDLKFFPYCKFRIKIAISFPSLIIPTASLLLGYLYHKLYGVENPLGNVPFWVISIYSAAVILMMGIGVIILPVLVL